MRRLRNLLLTFVVLLILPSQGLGQGTIKFTANPSWDKGDIKAAGEYTVDDGYTIVGVVLTAHQPTGGKGGQAVATRDATQKPPTWSARIPGPPNADFRVFARLHLVKDGNGYYVDTADVLLKKQ
ncbi:MAG TPA: hypothetical protein VEL76_24190 [Gemmataceae bacterium]|nr:hypothetical protein [Gemmataceae bacterium]